MLRLLLLFISGALCNNLNAPSSCPQYLFHGANNFNPRVQVEITRPSDAKAFRAESFYWIVTDILSDLLQGTIPHSFRPFTRHLARSPASIQVKSPRPYMPSLSKDIAIPAFACMVYLVSGSNDFREFTANIIQTFPQQAGVAMQIVLTFYPTGELEVTEPDIDLPGNDSVRRQRAIIRALSEDGSYNTTQDINEQLPDSSRISHYPAQFHGVITARTPTCFARDIWLLLIMCYYQASFLPLDAVIWSEKIFHGSIRLQATFAHVRHAIGERNLSYRVVIWALDVMSDWYFVHEQWRAVDGVFTYAGIEIGTVEVAEKLLDCSDCIA